MYVAVLLGITGKDFVIIAASKAIMRGPTIIKAEDDKTRELNNHTLMAFSGEAGDTVQFAEYIQANIQLYTKRNDVELSTPAVANFVRGELARSLRSRSPYTVNLLLGGVEPETATPHLYWIDYLASLAPVPYAAHGYAQYYCLSLLDKHHNPGITLDEGLKLLERCTDELKRRLPIDYKGVLVKVVTKDGVQVIDFDNDRVVRRELANFPAAKKARVEDEVESDGTAPDLINGHERNRHNGADILGTADEGQETIDGHPQEDSRDSEIDEEFSAVSVPKRQSKPVKGYDDLYLDTINRVILDFDFEKLCSVSLSNINVYACLVCGKYFQGRGPKSHAYFHALDVAHHVFINLSTRKVYVLPEGYEVQSKSLDDIKYVVDPHFSKEQVAKLDKEVPNARDIAGTPYRPGYVGMNNIKANDYLNVVVQLLAHVAPVRNFFLLQDFPTPGTPELVLRFRTLIRKLWNPRAFRAHVSPHELLQEVAIRSSKRFTLTKQADPSVFLLWFLNNLHLALGGSKKPSDPKKPTSIIHAAFQGRVKVESQDITAHSDTQNARLVFTESGNIESTIQPFLILTLDLPPTPLFQSADRESIIPQVSLAQLLAKYNGRTASEKLSQRNKFVSERNHTIVTHRSTGDLDMSPYAEPNPEEWPPGEPIMYDLVANVILDPAIAIPGEDDQSAEKGKKAAAGSEGATSTSGAGAGSEKVSWLIQLHDKGMTAENARHRAAGDHKYRGPEWLEVQDLLIKPLQSELLFTREGYLMVWERRKVPSQKAKGKEKAAAE
ncbi:cysteine proteinase [Penicillium chermesinum]|nr:cysteine proteinase [Penicillium chermesinum]